MKKHIHVIDCDSTQDLLKEQLMAQTAPTQFLVSCENQNQGRGRGQNNWKGMPGTLCFSFNLRAHPEMSFTALEISVLVTRFFEARGRKLKLKWPNDIWDENGKKCGGILVQGSNNTLIAGIGLNIFSDDEAFGGIYPEAVALDKRVWAQEIADFILHHRYKEVDSLQADWMARCGHLNQEVKIIEGQEVTEGIFTGIGIHGECLLNDGEKVHHLYNGSLRLK